MVEVVKEIDGKELWNTINIIIANLQKLENQIEALDKRLPSKIVNIDSLDVIKNGIAVVDFWAEWCLPCYNLLPALETVAKEFEDVKFYKIDIDKHPDIVEKLKIQSIPLIVVYKDGKEVSRLVGSPREKKEDYLRWTIRRAFVPQDEWEKTKEMVEKIAKVKGWQLNPDRQIREGLITALTYNRLKYGRPYCPCKPEHVKENICPCRPYKDYIGSEAKIEKEGTCYCGLFVRKM